MDKITGAAIWCPLHLAVSPITLPTSDSASLLIWTPVFLFLFFISASFSAFTCIPGWLHLLWDGYLSSRMWQKRTASLSISLPSQTPVAIKCSQAGRWDAIGGIVTYLLVSIDFFISLFFPYFVTPHPPPRSYSDTHRTLLMTSLTVLIRVRDCRGSHWVTSFCSLSTICWSAWKTTML